MHFAVRVCVCNVQQQFSQTSLGQFISFPAIWNQASEAEHILHYILSCSLLTKANSPAFVCQSVCCVRRGPTHPANAACVYITLTPSTKLSVPLYLFVYSYLFISSLFSFTCRSSGELRDKYYTPGGRRGCWGFWGVAARSSLLCCFYTTLSPFSLIPSSSVFFKSVSLPFLFLFYFAVLFNSSKVLFLPHQDVWCSRLCAISYCKMMSLLLFLQAEIKTWYNLVLMAANAVTGPDDKHRWLLSSPLLLSQEDMASTECLLCPLSVCSLSVQFLFLFMPRPYLASLSPFFCSFSLLFPHYIGPGWGIVSYLMRRWLSPRLWSVCAFVCTPCSSAICYKYDILGLSSLSSHTNKPSCSSPRLHTQIYTPTWVIYLSV